MTAAVWHLFSEHAVAIVRSAFRANILVAVRTRPKVSARVAKQTRALDARREVATTRADPIPTLKTCTNVRTLPAHSQAAVLAVVHGDTARAI